MSSLHFEQRKLEELSLVNEWMHIDKPKPVLLALINAKRGSVSSALAGLDAI